MSIVKWKKLIYVAITGLLAILIVVTIYIKIDTEFDNLPNQTQFTIKKDNQPIEIGIIGDSWVAGNKLDKAISDSLSAAGITANVTSSGHPGAKSRKIFRNLFSDVNEPYSSRSLWENKHLDYMIILAGINDTAGHIGSEFYAHHMLNIVMFAQSVGIFPIIVEIPEYNIENAPPEGTFSFFKRLIYQGVFDGMQNNVIANYRLTLSEKLLAELKDYSYFIVNFDPFISDYNEANGLYANALHLNERGYRMLGSYIGEDLVKVINLETERYRIEIF